MNNKRYLSAVMAVGITAVASSAMAATKVTIGTVNNGDMVRMQGLSDEFEKLHPDIDLNLSLIHI